MSDPKEDLSREDRKLARSRDAVSAAAERSAEAIGDALDAFNKARQAEGGELKKIALREEFTIVLDTSKRMLWVALVVAVLYAVTVPLALYGRVSVAVGVMLAVGMVGLLLLLFVHVMLYFFSRSDQKTHSQVVTYNIGQTVATRLMGIETMRSFMRELAAFTGSAMPEEQGEGDAAGQARARIEDFLKRMALDESLSLFGLHRIKRKRERIGIVGGAMVAVLVSSLLGAMVLSGVSVGEALGLSRPGAERLAMDDVAASSDGGASWSRGGPATYEAGDSVSPLKEVYHAPFGARSHFGFTVLEDGSVLVAGGAAPAGEDDAKRAAYADVWRGVKVEGRGWVSWERMTSKAGWSARWGHAMVAVGSTVVLVGGREGDTGKLLREVWVSADNGATWTKRSDFPGEARMLHAMAVGMDARREDAPVIYLAGGSGDKTIAAELWRSTDVGASWSRVGDASSVPWNEREAPALTVVRDAPMIAADVAARLFARLPVAADRTVDERALSAADLQTFSETQGSELLALLDARGAAVRKRWDGGSNMSVASDSLLGAVISAAPPTEEAKATAEQLAAVLAIMGTFAPPSSDANLARMTKAHYNTLVALDTGSVKKNLTDAISSFWKAPQVGTLVLTGGRPGTTDRARGKLAPIETFRSQDGGATWTEVAYAPGAKVPSSRRGHAMAALRIRTGQADQLVLVGGLQTTKGNDEGRPLGDVWISGDGGSSWQRVGTGKGRIDQVSSGPYDIPRRAFFGLGAVGASASNRMDLLVVAGDATGMPSDEREDAGLLLRGLNEGAAENVVSPELPFSTKVTVFVAGALVVLMLLLCVGLHWIYYRSQYVDIPQAYVRTEKAWREALERVATSPDKFEVPGSFAKIGKSVPQTLRSIGSAARSMSVQNPGSLPYSGSFRG